jgi:hypothetical protein
MVLGVSRVTVRVRDDKSMLSVAVRAAFDEVFQQLRRIELPESFEDSPTRTAGL